MANENRNADASSGAFTASFPIPPMSDSFARLLSFTEDDRQNPRLLELLVHKDPGAVALLLKLANSALYRRARSVSSVSDALTVLGSDLAVAALFGMWAIAELNVPPTNLVVRGWLARHTFSLCATIRRMLQYGRLDEGVSFLDLQLTALLDKLALATYLSVTETGSEIEVLRDAYSRNSHALHQEENLTPMFERSVELARAWGVGGSVEENLKALSSWKERRLLIPQGSQAVLLGELLLAESGQEGGDHEVLMDEFYETSTLMHHLVKLRVVPSRLAVRF